MAAMTMVSKVADPKWLDGLKVGYTGCFTAERIDGVVIVTGIAPAQR